jgi:hypothetical protein
MKAAALRSAQLKLGPATHGQKTFVTMIRRWQFVTEPFRSGRRIVRFFITTGGKHIDTHCLQQRATCIQNLMAATRLDKNHLSGLKRCLLTIADGYAAFLNDIKSAPSCLLSLPPLCAVSKHHDCRFRCGCW